MSSPTPAFTPERSFLRYSEAELVCANLHIRGRDHPGWPSYDNPETGTKALVDRLYGALNQRADMSRSFAEKKFVKAYETHAQSDVAQNGNQQHLLEAFDRVMWERLCPGKAYTPPAEIEYRSRKLAPGTD